MTEFRVSPFFFRIFFTDWAVAFQGVLSSPLHLSHNTFQINDRFRLQHHSWSSLTRARSAATFGTAKYV
jgi:hypothetical protein